MKRGFKIFVSLMLMFSLTACANKQLNVIVTNYPVQFLVNRIAGDRVNVSNISDGTIPQRATIKENYQEILKDAELFFYISELQPYFDLYSDDIKEAKIEFYDLSELSSLYPFKRYTTVYSGGNSALIEEPYYESEAFKHVDTYEFDPILWMDPVAMTSMARTIKDKLSEKLPDDAALFNENFENLEVELTKLQGDFQKLRDADMGVSFVSMTPSFGNWQKSFNIGVYPVTISKYGVLPNEAMLNEVRERVMRDNVRYIVYEEGMTDDYVKLHNQLKTELDLEVITLSNLFTLTEADKTHKYDYIAKMYQNLETLEAIIYDEH